jgi:hypothetical protein
MNILERLELEFAFPSRSIYLRGRQDDMLPAPAAEKG